MIDPAYNKTQLIELARSFEEEACERENTNPRRSASFYAAAADRYQQAGMQEAAETCRRKSRAMVGLKHLIDTFGDDPSMY